MDCTAAEASRQDRSTYEAQLIIFAEARHGRVENWEDLALYEHSALMEGTHSTFFVTWFLGDLVRKIFFWGGWGFLSSNESNFRTCLQHDMNDFSYSSGMEWPTCQPVCWQIDGDWRQTNSSRPPTKKKSLFPPLITPQPEHPLISPAQSYLSIRRIYGTPKNFFSFLFGSETAVSFDTASRWEGGRGGSGNWGGKSALFLSPLSVRPSLFPECSPGKHTKALKINLEKNILRQ